MHVLSTALTTNRRLNQSKNEPKVHQHSTYYIAIGAAVGIDILHNITYMYKNYFRDDIWYVK